MVSFILLAALSFRGLYGPVDAAALKINPTGVGKKSGCLVSERSWTAERGDTVFVTLAARGKGLAEMILGCRTAAGGPAGNLGNQLVRLRDDWQPFEFKVLVEDGRKGERTASFALLLDTKPGAVAEFREVSVEVVSSHAFGRDGWALLNREMVPFKVERLDTFDPKVAGWPLVFSDDFDGTVIDTNKWTTWPTASVVNHPRLRLDGAGHLSIRAAPNERGELTSGELWTKERFLYGYFEARLKFTRKPGWWSSFYLLGNSNTNPELDGYEIDIYEDEHMHHAPEGAPPQRAITHTLHSVVGQRLRSWEFWSQVPGDVLDWHVVGCRRTPFETSIYMDGKLVRTSAAHTSADSATFDPLNHAGAATPLHAILAGVVQNATAKTDESFLVDWMRIYAMPDGYRPRVEWATPQGGWFAPTGSVVRLTVGTDDPALPVYLFDNGFLVAYRKGAPCDFAVTLPPDPRPHVFSAFAQLPSGAVGWTGEKRLVIPICGEQKIEPGVTKLPGKLPVGIVRGTRSGEYKSYFVDVPRDGDYVLSLLYGTTSDCDNALWVRCGEGQVRIPLPKTGSWERRSPASGVISLKAGRHPLTLFHVGLVDYEKIEIHP